MSHYVCDICDMSATVVDTPVSRLAWLDHMTIHVRQSAFRQWVWYVTPLPFGVTP
jgi:hypothetical protein